MTPRKRKAPDNETTDVVSNEAKTMKEDGQDKDICEQIVKVLNGEENVSKNLLEMAKLEVRTIPNLTYNLPWRFN